MKTKILADSQICISEPLKVTETNMKKSKLLLCILLFSLTVRSFELIIYLFLN